MNLNLNISQAKAALNKNLAVTQSKLARTTAERDRALAQIQGAIDRAELAERSQRDIARELARVRGQLEIALAELEIADGLIERLRHPVGTGKEP